MNPRNDVTNEMRRLLLDRDTLERLVAGRVEPDDAPPGYAEVARVLGAAAKLSDPADLGHEAEHVAAARALAARKSPASSRSDGKSKVMRSKGHRLKVVGLVVLGTLVGTSGLAAAGVLPDTAQDMLSTVLGGVGISVPTSDHPASPGEQISEIGTTSDHPASSGEQISEIGTTSDHPASSGEQISEIARTTNSTGVGRGAEISSIASGGMSQAGQHGSVADRIDVAQVPTPNAGGTSTADTASEGRSDAGTEIADERSDGRSAAGSGNASKVPSLPPPPASKP